jgi:hypothetical protein
MAKMDKSDLKSMIKKSRVLFKGEELPKIHGYEGEVEKLVIREKGEIWTDKDGKEWKQVGVHNKVRTDTIFDKLRKELRTAQNCPKEICGADSTKFLDKRMITLKGMCFDCVQEHEAKLKEEGKYDDYEKSTMLKNERSFLQEAKLRMAESREYMDKNPEFMNEDGSYEMWDLPNKKKLLEDLDNDLEELEKRLETIEEELVPFKDMKF